MKIVIMRHAKVLIENRKIYANELKSIIAEYDTAPIEQEVKNLKELKALADTCNVFVSSGLYRSVESLLLLSKEADYVDEVFAELESFYTEKKIIQLSFYTWGFCLKLIWFLGLSNGSKSYKESKIEAQKASEILINLAKKEDSVMLMGHGLKNMLIVRALKQRGWKESKKMKMDNFEYGVYLK